MLRPCCPLWALWLVIVLGSGAAEALEVTPLLREFAPSGAGASQSFELMNDGAVPIALEISFVKRAVDIDGRDTLQPAGDDFLIFPEQFILTPGQRQTVRATWVGDPAPRAELTYRVIFEQLPVQALEGGALQTVQGQVQFIVKFIGSVYIRPPGVESKLRLQSVALSNESGTDPRLEIILSNTGTARAVLLDFALVITGKDSKQTVVLGPERLEALRGAIIHGGLQRRFLVAWPGEVNPGPIEGSLKSLRVK